MRALQGQVAIVTGAASGLGLAIAARLDAEGGTVISTDIDAEHGQAAADALQGSAFLRHDVTNEDDWTSVVAETQSRFGALDNISSASGLRATRGSSPPTPPGRA